MPAIGGRLQPGREAVEEMLKTRKGRLKSTGESKVTLKPARIKGNVQGVGKRAPLDHEPTGYARYGDGSSRGRRMTDEFSKGLFKPKAAKKVAQTGWRAVEHDTGQLAPGKLIDPSKIPFAPAGSKPAKGWGPVGFSKGLVRDMRTDRKKPGAMLRQTKSGTRQYLAHGDDGQPTWKDLPSSSPLSKRVRNKDAESDRQRRLGMGVAGAGAAGLLLGGRGVRNVVRTTRNVRSMKLNPHTNFAKLPPDVQAILRQKGRPKGFSSTYGSAAQVAGGTALSGGALGLEHYARSERNRRWE